MITCIALLSLVFAFGVQQGAHATQKNEQQTIRQQQQNGNTNQGGIVGVISDSKCGRVHTVDPGMGPTGCSRDCVDNKGAHYVLVTKDKVIPLSGDRKILENYAGENVRISGGTNVQKAEQVTPVDDPNLVTPTGPPAQHQ